MALEHTRSHAETPLSTDWMGAGTRGGKETQHQIDVFDADGKPHLRPKPNGPNATMRPQTVGLYETIRTTSFVLAHVRLGSRSPMV